MIIPNAITPIIKLTEACNYSCYFCRYANHPQANCVMELDDAKRILEETVKYNAARGVKRVKIIFHGGEPLLWGIDRFQQILHYEDELAEQYSVCFFNSIQTNGFLLNDQWVGLFKKYRFSVGISLDGPGTLNSHFGKIGNEASVKKVLANIQLLKRAEVPFGILSVITNAHTMRAKDFYDYWVSNGIENVGLCFCYNPEDKETVDCEALSTFLIELFNLYFYGTAKINFREFNNAIQRKLTKRVGACTFACRENCGRFLTFDSRLRVMFCDDYDLKKITSLATLREATLEDIVVSDRYQELCIQSRLIVEEKCSSCSVREFCGSGCYRNDGNNGNYFCSVYKKLYSHILTCLKAENALKE